MAFRSCAHCRKYVYDEKTGKPRETRGKLLPRVKPPPCETDGCPKGHWSKPIELDRRGHQAVRFYEQVRATSGSCMTEAERQDSWCLYVLSRLDQFHRSAEQTAASQQTASSIAAILATGGGHGTRR